jgi:uncharacterized repeat protein (TIGR01451 family)
MKRSVILGLGAIAIIGAVPFITNTPVLADLQRAGETLIKAINKPEIKLNLVAAKQVMEKNEDGVEVVTWKSLEDGAVVFPGDVLRYTVDSQNVGNLPAADLVITQPVPAKTVYVLGSARSNNGATITYSIDNGQNFVENPLISVVNEKGETELVSAPAEQYTHVRWDFEKNIDPAIGVKAMYDVKVP